MGAPRRARRALGQRRVRRRGALIALSGVVAIGIYIGIGGGFSGTATWVLCALAVVVAYVIELAAPRPLTAACTAVVAAGIPLAVAFSQWPFSGYSDVRTIEAVSVVVWLAVFAVGGTRRARARRPPCRHRPNRPRRTPARRPEAPAGRLLV